MNISLAKIWYIYIGGLGEWKVWLYVVSKEGEQWKKKIFIFQIESSIDNAYTAQCKSCHDKHVI